MRRVFTGLALILGAVLVAGGSASARESQLAGIRLGRPADRVTDLYGDPTRTHTGALPAAGAGAMAGAPGGMMGFAPGDTGVVAGPDSMMGFAPGDTGVVAGPDSTMGFPPGGMAGMPGMPGMPGAGAGQARPRERYQGRIAGMRPEDFAGRLLAPAPANPAVVAGGMGAALGPGMAPGMGGPGMGMDSSGVMGMPGMPGMPGMLGQPGAAAASPAITWIFERPRDGATFVFGFTEEGRVSLVTVGDDKPYSTPKGGRTPPFMGARTSKGITLGSSFKDVVIAYGFPESTEVLGQEVLVKYFERHNVAFTFRQGIPQGLRVTSISIKSPDD